MPTKVKFTKNGKEISGDEFVSGFEKDAGFNSYIKKAQDKVERINELTKDTVCKVHGRPATIFIEVSEKGIGKLSAQACCDDFIDKTEKTIKKIVDDLES